jgi:hypothetical protein
MPAAAKIYSAPKPEDYLAYMNDGYSTLQNIITTMILREATLEENAYLNMMAVPVPAAETSTSEFVYVFIAIFPLVFALTFIIPVYNMTFLLVKEKESRSKESMRMMGMSDVAYWFSWFVYYIVYMTVFVVIAWALLLLNVIEYTTPGYILLFFWVYGIAIFGEVIFFQSLFKRSKYAGVGSTAIYFLLAFCVIPMSDPGLTDVGKGFWCLIP